MSTQTGEGEPVPDSRSPLQTVDRALKVLLSYSESRVEWGGFELAEAFELDKSTAQRLLAALAVRGFLSADPLTRRYRLGPAMWRMAGLWERTGGLAALADRVLVRLAVKTGRTALFTVPDGIYVRCIAAVDGADGPVRNHHMIGELFPAHAGATSRAYFAFIDAHERRSLLAGHPIARYSDLTQVDMNALDALFEQTVTDGWAYSEGEYDAATRAVAAPVMLGKRPVGSLTLLEPKRPQQQDIRDFSSQVLEAAADLADLLANRPPAPARRDWRKRSNSGR